MSESPEQATKQELVEAYQSHMRHLIDVAVKVMEAQRAEIERLRAELRGREIR